MERDSNVVGLGALVATRKENDQLPPALREVHPVSGPVVDPQFRDTLAYRPYIPRISHRQPLDPSLNSRPGSQVT
jgi:hypothetical protein